MKGCNELRFCELQMHEIIEFWLQHNGGSFAQQRVTEFKHVSDRGAPTFVVELETIKAEGS